MTPEKAKLIEDMINNSVDRKKQADLLMQYSKLLWDEAQNGVIEIMKVVNNK